MWREEKLVDKERFYIVFARVKHQKFPKPLMPSGGQQDTITKPTYLRWIKL